MLENLQQLSYEYWSVYKKDLPDYQKFSQNISSQEVQNRIELIISDILAQLFSFGTLELCYLSIEKSCEYDPFTGVNRLSEKKTKTLKLFKNKESIAQLFKIFEISYVLLQTGTKATKREIFYVSPEVFITQKKSDKAIENACAILEIPRNRLNIISAGKGLLSGNIEFSEAGMQTIVGNRILKVPLDIDEIFEIKTQANFILIIEKETGLNRLVQERFFVECSCIGITGCGYPDMQTREFIRRIVNEFSWLPVFVLTDFDPHGFKILCTYTFGSVKMCGECDSLAIPFAHWIGVHCEESFSHIPLNNKDYKMIEKLLKMTQFNLPPNNYQNKRFGLWRLELEEMVKMKSKFEIESAWEGQLSEYVLHKINTGSWIYIVNKYGKIASWDQSDVC